MDLGAIAHLSTIKGRVPVLHFFDGFRTSHEIQKIEVWDKETLANMLDMDAAKAFRNRALNPEHPVLKVAQNPDIFFQAREASNGYYNAFLLLLKNTWTRLMLKSAQTISSSTTMVLQMLKHVIVAKVQFVTLSKKQ